jgi:sortase family protein
MAADRSTRVGLLLAILLPALSTGGAVLVVGRSDDPGVPAGGGSAAALARLAEDEARVTPALHPVSARLGAAALGPERLESLAGGVRPAPPSRISIPAAGIDAQVVPVSEHHGALTVPRIGEAGWFDAGPRPGEPGRAVLIGHLDTHQGPGLFARVPSLRPGTRITVLDRHGGEHDYNVVGGAQVRKNRFPARSVYGHADTPVLVLITCGGPFRPGRGYRDNVLLYARAA